MVSKIIMIENVIPVIDAIKAIKIMIKNGDKSYNWNYVLFTQAFLKLVFIIMSKCDSV